ncbi:MAG: thiamine-phosphate kinase [Bacteroidales bacterium]|nr:thiamine-phosphate kinase [Bacteroidales bacterium]MDD4574879.1 thiamine-phosphate kinase [Bacteroidales bacterium]
MTFFENTNHAELSEIGEFGLIDLIDKSFEIKHKETNKGIGDDAAVVDFGGKKTLITTDILTEGVHFHLSYSPLKHLGYKAVAVNLSDICAMNGTPKQITVGIALSSKFSMDAIEELMLGMKLACEKYNIDLIGGDTTSSAAGLFISITAIGSAKDSDITYRSGAKKGDLICVSGDLGGAYAGLLVLERERIVFEANPNEQIDLTPYDYIVQRQLKPEPRTDIVELLQKNKIKPTSMIDISDGLASEIKHICKQSELGCRIMEDKIPIDLQTENILKELNIAPTTGALNGGEDYELLFTVKQSDYEKIKDLTEVSIIGYMTEKEEGIYLITTDNKVIEIQAQGWDGLKKEVESSEL